MGHEECLTTLRKAIDLVDQNIEPYKAVTQLGEGWVGEEALAIALYCALRYPKDFKKALCLAVNHSGDRIAPVQFVVISLELLWVLSFFQENNHKRVMLLKKIS